MENGQLVLKLFVPQVKVQPVGDNSSWMAHSLLVLAIQLMSEFGSETSLSHLTSLKIKKR